jgi:hypothetical protein
MKEYLWRCTTADCEHEEWLPTETGTAFHIAVVQQPQVDKGLKLAVEQEHAMAHSFPRISRPRARQTTPRALTVEAEVISSRIISPAEQLRLPPA